MVECLSNTHTITSLDASASIKRRPRATSRECILISSAEVLPSAGVLTGFLMLLPIIRYWRPALCGGTATCSSTDIQRSDVASGQHVRPMEARTTVPQRGYLHLQLISFVSHALARLLRTTAVRRLYPKGLTHVEPFSEHTRLYWIPPSSVSDCLPDACTLPEHTASPILFAFPA